MRRVTRREIAMLKRNGFWLAVAVGVLAAVAVRAEELPFQPGEELTLSISYLKMNVANVKVSVSERQLDGSPVWPVELKGQTRGFFSSLYEFEETFVSQFDPSLKRSVGHDLQQRYDGIDFQETVRYVDTTASVHRNKKGAVTDQTRSILPGSQDVLGAIYTLRSLPLLEGAEFNVPIFTGNKSWNLEGKVVGRKALKVENTWFDTVVVRCRTHFDGKFAANRDLTVWLTNDARRLPVKLEADFMVGTMTATLKGFRSGALAWNE